MNTRLSPEREKRLSERYASPDWINELDACDIAEDFAALLAELDAVRQERDFIEAQVEVRDVEDCRHLLQRSQYENTDKEVQ